jgi:hypothetical protein
LEDVLPIARTIQDANSGLPMDRELLASALGTTSSSSGFRMKLTSSAKYKLTVGGYSDENIALTPLGQQCVAPQGPAEARASLVGAASEPEIFRNLYRLLNGKRMPEELYARNMLVREMAVHPDLASECLSTVIANGLFSGILTTEGRDLMVNFDEGPTSDDVTHAIELGAPRAPASSALSRLVEAQSGVVLSTPSIFVGFYESSESVTFIVDTLNRLGLNSVQGNLSPDSQSLSLSSDVTKAMQVCDAGIVVESETRADTDSQDLSRERAIWLFLGAATFQFGDKVVLVGSSSGASLAPPQGIRTVKSTPDNPEATALGILTALFEVGAIKIVS